MARKVPKTPSLPTQVGSTLESVRNTLSYLGVRLMNELADLYQTYNALVDQIDTPTDPVQLASFAKASLPTASLWTGALIYVTDDVGGAVPAFSDGTNWRRVQDRAIIS